MCLTSTTVRPRLSEQLGVSLPTTILYVTDAPQPRPEASVEIVLYWGNWPYFYSVAHL